MSLRGLAPLVPLLLATARPGWAQPALVTLPLDDPAYVQVERAVQTGCTVLDVSPYRPWRLAALRAALTRSLDDAACDRGWLAPLIERFLPPLSAPVDYATPASPDADSTPRWRAGISASAQLTGHLEGESWPPWMDLRPTSAGTPPGVGIVRGRIGWADEDRVVAVAEGYAQTSGRNDPTARGRGFRQTSAVVDFSEAYLAARLGRYLVVSLGRGHEAWLGPRGGRESVVLSALAPPLDRFTIEASWSEGRWQARAVMAGLDRLTLTPELDSVAAPRVARRAFVAHALTWRPTPALELTLGEAAVLTRESAGMDLAYANPLMIYLVTENDASRADVDDRNNLAAFGGARVRMAGVTLDAELLIDDIQIDGADREEIPDQLAWRIAATGGLGQRVIGSLEYARIGSYTYIRDDYSTAFQSFGQPLGSELGPDADRVRGSAEVWVTPKARLQAGAAYWRHGAQRLGRRPGVSAIGHAGEPYPSVRTDRPSVQTAGVLDVTAQWLDAVVPVTARAELLRIENANNQPDPPRTYARFQLVASFRFRFP